jgi:Fe-S cluster biogenesis protein NfuA
MFIQTEATPNPNSLKFIPGQEILGAGVRDFADAAAAGASPLADEIFRIEGVERVFFGADFVSVTKSPDAEWAHLKPFILGALMEHLVAGRPILLESATKSEAPADSAPIVYEGEAQEIVAQIEELIETRVRPAVAQDGGDIIFHSWDQESGVVKLHMRGACAGCPSSTLTLKQGIENMLKHYVPEVTRVEQVV